ncbi:MAG: hypothetical protein FWD98_02220 [Defluviitaleaceae bacterium]|nr:hypothetical protein [Defluviitaleaceae bacterium]
MKRALACLLAAIMAVTAMPHQARAADITIENHPPEAVFTGVPEAMRVITNINFTDIPDGAWAQEAIVRAGAMDVLWGYDRTFAPHEYVSNEEAIAFAVRATGAAWETLVAERLDGIREAAPPESTTRDLWHLSFLNVALEMGIISQEMYDDATAAGQEFLDPETSFVRGAPATRENAAYWLVRALETENEAIFDTGQPIQHAFNFPDWDDVSIERMRTMERALQRGMIRGRDGEILPHSFITGMEMAAATAQMDPPFLELHGMERRSGTVGLIREAQTAGTTTGTSAITFYIRTDSGIDHLVYQVSQNASPSVQPQILDAVVFRDGITGGMLNLQEGDVVEYLVRSGSNEVFYIFVHSANAGTTPRIVTGVLNAVNLTNGTITVDGTTFPLMQSARGANEGGDNFLMIDLQWVAQANVPVGSRVELTLRNNVVQWISFVGQPVLVLEERGIVIDNNPFLGYITYFNVHGQEVTRFFIDSEMTVRKQPFYLTDDEVGYLSDMFTNFRYNPMEAHISEIVPGDIVFMRFDPANPENIVAISASPNHIYRHGRILSITQNVTSPLVYTLIIEYDNRETTTFNVPGTITPWSGGRPITWADVQVGDVARMLVNRAILEPGFVEESIKEIIIEGGAHFIPTIVRGQLSSVNRAQNLLQINNAQTLSESGWTNHNTIYQYSIARREIEYFLDGRRISLDHAIQHLRRGAEVYIALENHFAGPRVRKVTFRTGRDELLPPDTVMSANAQGFSILLNEGTIATDEGTIVRRNNRLVSAGDIHANDFVRVSLNGGNRAAIVDIFPMPSTAGTHIVVGNIQSINETQSFTVQAMSSLDGNEWSFTPIQRIFTFDHDTPIRHHNGTFVPHEHFTTYVTEEGTAATTQWPSFLNQVVHVVVHGSRAELIVIAPPTPQQFPNNAVRGTIIETAIEDGVGQIRLNNAQILNPTTGAWSYASNINRTAVVEVDFATITVSNNRAVRAADLQPGQSIRVMVPQSPQTPITPPFYVYGLIILVE